MIKLIALVLILFCSLRLQAQWKSINNGLPSGSTNTYYTCITALDTNLYLGTNRGVFRSSDKGENWNNIGLVYINSKIVETQCIAAKDSVIYVGTHTNGIYSYNESEGIWKQSGLNFLDISCLSLHDKISFAGTIGGGLYRSFDNCKTWESVKIPITHGTFITSIGYYDSILYVGVNGDTLHISTDKGDTWTKSQTWTDYSPNCIAKINGILFAGYMQLYQSVDNGRNWEICNGLPVEEFHTYNSLLNCDSMIFVSHDKKGIYFSKDNGKSWRYAGLEGDYKRNIICSNNYIYATSYDYGVLRAPIIAILTNIEEQIDQNDMADIFPNPATNHITIQLSEAALSPVCFTVSDIFGRTILNGQIPVGAITNEIQLGQLSFGLYAVTIADGLFRQSRYITITQ